jgi:hypothetical protein
VFASLFSLLSDVYAQWAFQETPGQWESNTYGSNQGVVYGICLFLAETYSIHRTPVMVDLGFRV